MQVYPAVPHQYARQRARHWLSFQGPPFGYGVLTAGLVLALMILPYHRGVAGRLRHGSARAQGAAYGIGSTTFEVVGNMSFRTRGSE